MLSRRIPVPPNQPPPRPQQQQHPQHMSALPLHLQRSTTVAGLSPHPPPRSSTPPAGPAPYRSASPFRNRPMSVPPPRPQSPLATTSAGTGSHPITAAAAHLGPPVDPLDVDLVVRSIPHGTLLVDKPFRVACTLGVAASVRDGRQQRTLSLAVQHVQLQSAAAAAPVVVAPLLTAATASHLPPLAGVTTTPSSPATRAPLVLLDGPFVGSPRITQQLAGPEAADESPLHVPPPVPVAGDEGRYEKLRGATHFLGPSTLLVPPMTFAARTIPETSTSSGAGEGDDKKDDVGAESNSSATKKEERFWEFELAYAPLKPGFVPVGGLRVLLLEDRVDGGAEAYLDKRTGVPVTLREWDVIGEIWVKS